jgi:PAS domain S-box-containing protein
MASKHNRSDDAAGLRKRAEEVSREMAMQPFDDIQALSPEEMLEMLHELSVHKIELELQNEELRRTQAELDCARERYFDLYNQAPVGYCTISEKGLVIEANLTAFTLLGVNRGSLLWQPLTRFVLPEDQDIYYLHRKPLFENGNPQTCELRMVKNDGTEFWAHLIMTIARNTEGLTENRIVLRDITDRKRTEVYREMVSEILQILNVPEDLKNSIQRVLMVLKTRTGFDAVGIRLQDGNDFPYYVQDGFSRNFLQTENTLAVRSEDGGLCRDNNGDIMLECTCGLVISGKTDPANPLFTRGGSCWTNDSVQLLIIPHEDDPRLHPRNQCIHQGYASVALVPIWSKDRVVGLIQFNDRRKGCFTLDTVELLEGIALHIGTALMRKRAEESLQNSENMHKTVLKTAMDGFFMTDMQGHFLKVNDAFCQMSGYSENELLAMSFTDLKEAYIPADTAAHIQRIVAEGQDRFETRYCHKDGSVFDMEVSLQYMPIDEGRIVVFLRDITERKRVQDKIHKLSQLLLQSQENERHLISCELHDSIAQNLSALKINCDLICNDPSMSSFEIQNKVATSSRLLQETINEVRNLAYELRLTGLDELGLVNALENYCAGVSEKGKTKINFNSTGMTKIVMSGNMEIHIYRLIQEGLNNILKHADTSHADIQLMGAYPNIILRIEDAGRGFDVKEQELLSANYKRLGIRSMQERVNLLNGQMTIHSQPLKGTKIFIKIPLPETPQEAENIKSCSLPEL